MTVRVAINGFGRMGRLGLRAAWDQPQLEIVHVNEAAGDHVAGAHLLQFDSIQGTWANRVEAQDGGLRIDDGFVSYSNNRELEATDWAGMGIDLVIECTGAFKSVEALAPYFAAGVKKVVVSAPVADPSVLNVVVGVNDHLYTDQPIVTAASCTTNCIAPVIHVMHETFRVRHGSITTIHDITNTQRVLDAYHKDLRRARASGVSLIPTSTGSAKAIGEIIPELAGKLDAVAVRVPITNASLSDLVLEVERETTVEQVNAAMQSAATGALEGVLGYEERPLVSVDYQGDTRSSIIDAASTRVVGGTQVKLLAWYDNEIGYVHRMTELAVKVAERIG